MGLVSSTHSARQARHGRIEAAVTKHLLCLAGGDEESGKDRGRFEVFEGSRRALERVGARAKMFNVAAWALSPNSTAEERSGT